jgi:peptidoglycan/xylan/chitin deacetylase (PgdA/CDA1 family)
MRRRRRLGSDGDHAPGSHSSSPTRDGCRAHLDDGPDPELTPQLLDVLETFHAPVTFFVEGANVHAYPRSSSARPTRHEVGNHTDDHANRQPER